MYDADGGGRTRAYDVPSFWSWLNEKLEEFTVVDENGSGNGGGGSGAAPPLVLPFDFRGGLVGYLGYELKSECGSSGSGSGKGACAHRAPTPDAAFFFVDQCIVLDHATGDVYILALYDDSTKEEANAYIQAMWTRLEEAMMTMTVTSTNTTTPTTTSSFVSSPSSATTTTTVLDAVVENGHHPCYRSPSPSPLSSPLSSPSAPLPLQKQETGTKIFDLRESKEKYLANIQACMDALYSGNSYELCLTTELSVDGDGIDAWELYKTLRHINPAPYSAFMNFSSSSFTTTIRGSRSTTAACTEEEEEEPLGNQVPPLSNNNSNEAKALSICCSSPERFLRGGTDYTLEAKPIKGTAPRVLDDAKADQLAADALAHSEKDRAENLMIVDLLRNDLGRVCEPGSVHVPTLMQIESFATVHQLVSTVRGKRQRGASVVEAVKAAFPGGSMTGAPKIRSMEILDALETGPRGVYSGSLGYFSLNGAFDLNIVIRTAVLSDGGVRIGAGGAIVVQSDPEGEYEEMRLKAAALERAVNMVARDHVVGTNATAAPSSTAAPPTVS